MFTLLASLVHQDFFAPNEDLVDAFTPTIIEFNFEEAGLLKTDLKNLLSGKFSMVEVQRIWRDAGAQYTVSPADMEVLLNTLLEITEKHLRESRN